LLPPDVDQNPAREIRIEERPKDQKNENQNQNAGGSSGTGSTEGKNPSENVPNDNPPPRRGGRRGPPFPNNRERERERERSRPQNETVQKEKIQSKTAVFVANLPFSVDDEGLTKIFEEFNVKTAHVVKTRTGRSRGYGFVDFASEKDQQAAIPAKHNKEVTGNNGKNRQISVTVSHSVAQQQPQQPLPGTPQQQQQPQQQQPQTPQQQHQQQHQLEQHQLPLKPAYQAEQHQLPPPQKPATYQTEQHQLPPPQKPSTYQTEQHQLPPKQHPIEQQQHPLPPPKQHPIEQQGAQKQQHSYVEETSTSTPKKTTKEVL